MNRILIHGLGQTSNSWDKVASQLDSTDHIICPDMKKLLEGKTATYYSLYSSFSTMCDEIEEPISLCGLSLGGILALNYTIEHPQKVKSLVLVSTQYKMPKTLLKIQNIVFRFMPKSMFQQMGFEKKELLNLCKTMMELDFSDSLHKILCPTLIIYGEKDGANKKAAIELTNGVANAEIRVLDSVGHEANTEAPEKLSKVICDFYQRD